MTDWAAALTYYSVLAIFPALLAVVSVLGLDRPVRHAAAHRQHQHARAGPRQGPLLGDPQHPAQQRRRRRALRRLSRWPSGRPRATWPPSCAPPTSSTTSARGARSGRPCPPLPHDRSRCSSCSPSSPSAWPSPAASRTRSADARRRRHRGDRLGHRQMASARARRDGDVRAPVLGRAERQAPALPLGHARQHRRRGAVDRRLGRCSPSTSGTSPRTTRPTARWAASIVVPGLAVDLEHRPPARRRARTPRSSAAARSRPATPRTASRSSSPATPRSSSPRARAERRPTAPRSTPAASSA